MTQAATDMQNVLYTIPNIPYDEVPEGVGAEDNVVEKMGKHIYTFYELSFNGCKDKEKTNNQAMKTYIKKKGDTTN